MTNQDENMAREIIGKRIVIPTKAQGIDVEIVVTPGLIAEILEMKVIEVGGTRDVSIVIIGVQIAPRRTGWVILHNLVAL